jgi:hypothetical protein
MRTNVAIRICFGLLTCIAADGDSSQVVPAVARARGAFGSEWRSSLQIFNPFPTARAVCVKYFPQGADASAAEKCLSLQGYENYVVEDVLSEMLGVDEGLGWLEISDESLMVDSRAYNISSAGTFGQSVPVFPPSRSLYTLQSGFAWLPLDGTRFRVNADIYLNGTAEVALYTASGFPVGTRVKLSAGGKVTRFSPVSALFGNISLPTGGYIVLTVLDGRAGALLSMIDNGTSAPTTIEFKPIRDGSLGVR